MNLPMDDGPWADAATRSLLTSIAKLCETVGARGFSRFEDGVASFVSGGQIPTLNSVVVVSPTVDVADVSRLLDEVASTGLPYSVQARPSTMELVTDLLTGRGMSVQFETPLMVRTSQTPPASAANGLAVHELGPGNIGRHVAVMAAGFEIPEDIFADVMKDKALELPDLRCYLGDVAGEPVATGIGMLAHDLVGVFNVATPPSHRRLGYGTAITGRIVADGLAAGARGAYLQSSAQGYAVYQRLDFYTVERWPVWV